MKQLFKLRKERKDTLEKAEALNNITIEENRDFTEDEQAQYNEYMETVEALDKRIERMEELENKIKTLPAEEDNGLEISGDGKITGGEPELTKDPKRGFKTYGDFLVAVKDAGDPNVKEIDERLKISATVSGMEIGTGNKGGHLAPPAYSTQMYTNVMNASESFLSVVDVYTVERGNDSIVFPAVDETSRADGSRWGGVRGYWAGEGVQRTSSYPQSRQLTLAPHELSVLIYATDKLYKNSPIALGQFVQRAATDEIAFQVGNAIISGNGSNKPKGVLENEGTVAVEREVGQTPATIIGKNIGAMWARMPSRNKRTAIWLINQEYEAVLDELNAVMTDVGGTTTIAGFSSRIYDAQANTIKGRPVMACEYCSELNTVGDIILWDPKAYAMGIRGGVDFAMSIHIRFDYGETAFRFVFEADGKPWYPNSLTPLNGSNQLSPYVTLEGSS